MAYRDPSSNDGTYDSGNPATQVEGTLSQLQILAQTHPEIMHDPSIVAAMHDPGQLQAALQGWMHRNGQDPNSVYDDKGDLQNSSWFSDNLPWITALMGGALVAPAAIGAFGGGAGAAGAAGAEGGLDALGPTTAGSMAATTAAEAAPAGIAAGGGGAAAGGAAAAGTGILSHLTSEKGLATLASLVGPSLAEAFAPKPQQYNSFAGGPNDPNASQADLGAKLNAVFDRINNRDISLPDANLSMPTTHYSGGGLPMDIGIHPTSSGPFGNPGGAKPSGLGGLTGSTSDFGGLTPPGPSVSRVAGPGAPSGAPAATPDDYASAHQALKLLKGSSRPGNI